VSRIPEQWQPVSVRRGARFIPMATEVNTVHANTKHGHSRRRVPATRTYKAWRNMKTRALNPNREEWPFYGGRGITIYPAWLEYEPFLRDMGECPLGMTLERKDNNGNYEPSNCKWATREEQVNNRRNSRRVTFNGKTLTIGQWAKVLGISSATLKHRIDNWETGRALMTPVAVMADNKRQQCLQCGSPLRSFAGRKLYCSQQCRYLYRFPSKQLETRRCLTCGSNFQPMRPTKRYCSDACRHLFNSRRNGRELERV
jgi:hypothetical protein